MSASTRLHQIVIVEVTTPMPYMSMVEKLYLLLGKEREFYSHVDFCVLAVEARIQKLKQ